MAGKKAATKELDDNLFSDGGGGRSGVRRHAARPGAGPARPTLAHRRFNVQGERSVG